MNLTPLVCNSCGGSIDRNSMICEFCGIRYKLDSDMLPVIVERFEPNVKTICSSVKLDREMIMHIGAKEASEIALKEMSRKLAEVIAPFISVRTEYNAPYHQQIFEGRIRLIQQDYRFKENDYEQ